MLEFGKESLMAILFDENNMQAIEMVNERKERVKFSQVFVTVYGEEVYCILAPINEVKGLDSNVGLVFKVSEESLRFVENEDICTEIFNMYYSSLNKSN
ncbi:MAG: hypothetical protein IJ039_02445 [Clostridia bacterium]|nr:hypothetical protein [Clostridia bacterium]